MSSDNHQFDILERILQEDEIIVFLGAGASWDSGLPMGDQAGEELVHVCFSQSGLLDLEPHQEDAHSWPRFEVVLDILSRYQPNAPSGIVRTFLGGGLASTHRLLAGLNTKVNIITTNFDDQMERAYAEIGKPFRVMSSRSQMAEITDMDEPWILKLHGDADALDPESDYGVRIDQILRDFPEPISEVICAQAKAKPVIFIGYSGRDPDLSDLVQQVIRDASSVAWIALDDEEVRKNAQRFLGLNTKSRFYGKGAPQSLSDAMQSMSPGCRREQDHWKARVREWAMTQERDTLIQAAANFCLERGDPDALSKVVGIHAFLDANKDGQHLLWRYEREAEVLLRAEKPDETKLKIVVAKLLELADVSKAPDAISGDALVAAGNLYFRTGKFGEGVPVMRRAVEVLRDQSDEQKLMRALNNFGICCIYAGGDLFKIGIRSFRESLALSREHNHPILEAESTMRLAIGLMRSGGAKEAIELLEQILPFEKEMKNQRRLFVWEINYAEALRHAGRFADAAERSLNTLNDAKAKGDFEVAMNAIGNLANNRISLGQVALAEEAFDEVEAIPRTKLSGETYGNYLYNRGWLRITLGQWELALPWMEKAANYYAEGEMNERAGGAMGMLAWCHTRLGNRERAAAIIEDIEANGLIPEAGVFKRDYTLGKFAVYEVKDSGALTVDQICDKFEDDEARFMLAILGIEYRCEKGEGLAHDLVFLAAESARKECVGAFWAILANHLSAHHEPQLIRIEEEAFKKRPAPLDHLMNHLRETAGGYLSIRPS